MLAASEADDLVDPRLLDRLGVTGSLRSAAFAVRSVSGATVSVRLQATTALSLPWARALVRKARSGPAGAGYVPEDELQLTGRDRPAWRTCRCPCISRTSCARIGCKCWPHSMRCT